MNIRIQLTVSHETYQNIRSLAQKEHRTVPAQLLKLLETHPQYPIPVALTVAPLAPAAAPLAPAATPLAPAATPLAPTGPLLPAELALPAQRASDTDKTGWTDAEIDTWNHTEICPLWRPGLALPV